MPGFTTADYDHLFSLGRQLYSNSIGNAIAREIAVELMAMVESVRGQQSNWPKIAPRYQHLTEYHGPSQKLELNRVK